ncbi:MAG: DNA helicase II [Gammaproteobacteria bacterium]|nr:DNA helicase II [Gammaproteobacteria bacterium]MBT8150165.1 DNA helicase II [Gammaproteobacteria bacterium]
MDVSRILDPLNAAQREAVSSEQRSLLVLAGAGSGKTRALVHRIAWLLQVRGVPASAILAVTFTNKAAREMRARIGELLQMSPQGMWVGTFHGLAHRLLKAHWQDAGLPQNFQIIDSDDQLRLVKRLLKEHQLDETRFAPKSIQWKINGYKDEGIRAAHVDHHDDPYEKTLQKIYLAYEQACERAGQVDFGELLLRSHELWLKQPALLAHYQQRFSHILVDEFQDTNTIQYAWLRVLAGNSASVTAVGDDDQSIYGWRGARIENIQNFSEDFPGTSIIKLEQNYRSTSTILDAANAVIANNPGRLGKNLWTEGGSGEPISLYAGYNEQDEARFMVERVAAHFEEDVHYSQQAVLYRSNAQSRVLEEELIRSGIPYRIYGGQRFYDRLEIRNAVAYLRLAYYRQDDAAFERVVNTPTRGIGAKTVELLRERARNANTSLWDAACFAVSERLLTARASNALQKFIDLVDQLGEASSRMTLPELTELALDASDLMAFHSKEAGEKGRARKENLQELLSAAKQFQPEQEDTALREFLDTAALDAGEQQADAHVDALQLMTLHSAKGLEFPVVYLVGVEENLFPHRMSAEDPEQLAEERRLAYVGITRAMQKLYLCYAESRRFYGQDSYNAVSRFVREIPSECIEEVRINATVSRPLNARGALQSGADDTGLQLGQRVWHEVFGEGVVLGLEGQGSHARVQVNFDDEGSKWLVAAYANLQGI